MKQINLVLILFIAFCLGTMNLSNVYSQTNQKTEIPTRFELTGEDPKTIAEIFDKVPLEFIAGPYFKGTKEAKENAKKTYGMSLEECFNQNLYFAMTIKDLRNGYMRMESLGDGEGAYYELTYFRQPDQSKLLAIGITHWGMTCEPTELRLIRIKDGIWELITDQLLPEPPLTAYMDDNYVASKLSEEYNSDPEAHVSLPRRGKTITYSVSGDCEDIIFEVEPGKFEYFAKHHRYDSIQYRYEAGKFVMKKFEKKN